MRVFIAFAFALSTSPVFAQTVEAVLDLSALGWGAVNMPDPIETDGDFSTREWLVQSATTGELRVVAERNGVLCTGTWFRPSSHIFITVALRRVGVVHKLLVRDRDNTRIVALDTPDCGFTEPAVRKTK